MPAILTLLLGAVLPGAARPIHGGPALLAGAVVDLDLDALPTPESAFEAGEGETEDAPDRDDPLHPSRAHAARGEDPSSCGPSTARVASGPAGLSLLALAPNKAPPA